MADILVLIESKTGKIKGSSAELLSEATRLASSLGGAIKGLMIGDGVSSLAPEAGAFGASEVFVAEHADYATYNTERDTAIVADACKESGAGVVLATAGAMGRDLLPRVAARLNTGMISECIKLEVRDGRVVGKRPIYAGKCLIESVIAKANPQIITCRPNVFETTAPDSSKKATVTKLAGDYAGISSKAKITKIEAGKSDKPDLTEANVIVSGGRSLKSGENFKLLQDLADVLGGAVGASRAAVDAGYVGHDMQVGQTGKTVNPQLYIACGISGAIQHLAGMRTSKVIVAINSDAEAPIFQVANYGIVGDLFQVVPKFTEALKSLLKD